MSFAQRAFLRVSPVMALALAVAISTPLRVAAGPCEGALPMRTTGAPTSSTTGRPDLSSGYRLMLRNLEGHFWQLGAVPHIRPTNGANPAVGEVNDALATPSFWQMASFANVLYWDWMLTRSEASRAKLLAQWRYVRGVWTDRQLSSADPSTGIMNVSDDAAWAINYLVQTYAATGDIRALDDAKALLPTILDRWADPNAPRVSLGRLRASPHGVLYATSTGDPDHQGVASIFEAMIANAALEIRRASADQGELAYAKATFAWSRTYLRQRSTGLYYTELDIRPRLANGAVNSHYLKPIGDNLGAPVRGLDATYLAGTMAMGVLAARLYKLTGEASYLAEAQSTAAAMARNDTYLRSDGALVNARDPWTDGYWAPAYAVEVLSLPGVDPSHRLRAAMINTAASILSRETPDGYYGADWTGPERNPADGSMTWDEDARRRAGSGAGQALANQIMTSSSSASMTQGGLAAQRPSPSPRAALCAIPEPVYGEPRLLGEGACGVFGIERAMSLYGDLSAAPIA
jgi:hypothetical protein